MKKTFLLAAVIFFIACQKNSSSAPVANDNSTTVSADKNTDGTGMRFVRIGTQKWMAANLNVTHYRNGDKIPEITGHDKWLSATTGAWCWYQNDSASGSAYGRLYNWAAVNDPRGLAPEGWHIPSLDEYKKLFRYLGSVDVAGGAMKETGTIHWTSPNTDANNISGFTALPGGIRINGRFRSVDNYGYLWTSTKLPGKYSAAIFLTYNSGNAATEEQFSASGTSVRCLKDTTN